MGERDRQPPEPMELVRAAVWAHGRRHHELFDEVVAVLLTVPTARLAGDLASRLVEQVAQMWERGWQPADLHRTVARRLGRTEAALLAGAVLTGSSAYRSVGAQVAPGWMRQVDALAGGSVHRLPDATAPWVSVLVASLRLLHALEQLPDLPVLGPPPSAWRAGVRAPTDASGTDAAVDGVCALLARAESADAEGEAEALTVEAQALAATRAIDRAALVGEDRDPAPAVVARRIPIDPPYRDVKAELLAGVCAANGTCAVWTRDLGFTTVFGLPADVDVVQELFGSLLVQSSRALRRAGSRHDRFGRNRTTRFRRAFLESFATRIPSRLAATVDAVLDADDRRPELLSGLAARDAAVERAAAAAFPGTAHEPARSGRRETWVAATLFDDAPHLAGGGLVDRRSA